MRTPQPKISGKPAISATDLPEDLGESIRLDAPGFANKGWRWRLLVLLIGLLAMSFRFYYLTHAQVLQPFDDQAHARADGVEYYAYARNLVQHGVFTQAPEGHMPLAGDSYRDPGYPVFLAMWLKIFPRWDQWYPAVLLSQGLLGTMSVVFALYLSRRWMPMRWLAAAGVFMAIWPHSISSNSFILSETLSGFLCMSGMLLLNRAFFAHSIGWATAGGFGLALGALTNAILLPFAPLLGIYFAYRRLISTRMLLGLMAGALILPAAWMLRNAQLPPSNESSSVRALSTFVIGAWPHFYENLRAAQNDDPVATNAISRVNDELNLIDADPHAGIAQVAKRISEHPFEYLRWYFIGKPILLWDWNIRVGVGDIYAYPTRHSPFEDDLIYRIVIAVCHTLNPELFFLMIFGGVAALWPGQRISPSLAASTLLLIFVTTVYSILQAEPRYSIAYRPLEILLATFAVYRGGAWIGSMKAKRANNLGKL